MLNKLKKQIEKHYKKDKQHLNLETWEMFFHNPKDKTDNCSFDIYIHDGPFLFTIQNYHAFSDLDIYHWNYLDPKKSVVVKTWDGVRASCTPFYMGQTFTLPKFTPLTEQDIKGCAMYFCRKVLETWHIWNINVDLEPENTQTEHNQMEFDFEPKR